MTDQLQQKADLFIQNVQTMKDNFKWDYSLMHRMIAFLYTRESKEVDIEGIKKAKELIKDNTGFFSAFKDSNTFLVIAAMIAIHEYPQDYLKNAIDVYDRMKKVGFHTSNYLTISSLVIAQKTEEINYDYIIQNSKNYYDRMKQEHRFLTSSDDYLFATMLGMSELGIDSTIKEIEECYRLLKEDFFSGNSVQSLCHVLAFGEEAANIKCIRVVKIYETLKAKKCKIGSDGELTSLGILALVTDDVERIADEIVEVSDYIHNKKGFGSFSVSNSERNRYAAALVSSTYVQNLKDDILNVTLQNSLTNILIAQETAMIAAITASTVTVASSSD